MGFLRKNSLLKIVAVAACFGIISLSFPGVVQAADKNPDRNYFKNLLKRPMDILRSFFPNWGRAFIHDEESDRHSDRHSDRYSNDSSNYDGEIRIVGNSISKKKPKSKDSD